MKTETEKINFLNNFGQIEDGNKFYISIKNYIFNSVRSPVRDKEGIIA
jgi:hypothetical protein